LLKRKSSLDIGIIEPSISHFYQPAWTLVGGGAFDILKTKRSTHSVIPKQCEWIHDKVKEFRSDENTVVTQNGESVGYDYLVVAVGLQTKWNAIEGLSETLGKNGVTSNYSFDFAPYTWELVKNLKNGRAIFTQAPMPIKCPGAPQKAMYLACYEWLTQGRLKNIEVEFHNAGPSLFGVAAFVPSLMEYVKKYNINLNFSSNLVRIDGLAKKAWFNVKDSNGETTLIEKSFDLLHVCPVQGPHDCLIGSDLANAEGWVEVDQVTMQHTRFKNVFAVGDCCSTPNSKTAAAARKQIVIASDNLISLIQGESLISKYDGYGSCPLTVENGRIVLAEFGYGGKLMPTFPWLINPLKATRMAWFLKKTLLPIIYWHGMLKGREWFTKTIEN